MNKTELASAIAEKAEISKKDAEKALKAFTEVVAEELKKGENTQVVGSVSAILAASFFVLKELIRIMKNGAITMIQRMIQQSCFSTVAIFLLRITAVPPFYSYF